MVGRAVGFVGLGNMGRGMAQNMASRFSAGAFPGHHVCAFDVRPDATSALSVEHPTTARAALSVREVARECRFVFLCLPDGKVVEDVIDVMAPHLSAGSLVIDCSTTGPTVAKAAAATLKQGGVNFLDAPVTGAPERAAAGTLTAMVAGDPRQVAAAQPLLGTFASRIVRVGLETGQGQSAKALNNCLYNISVAAMAELLPLAAKAGLELEPFTEVVSTGTGRSFGFEQWAPLVLRGEFAAPRYGFPMGEAFKDFETLAALVEEHGSGSPEPPVLAAARSTYERALEMGLGREHKGAMVKVWEAELGVECRASNAGKPSSE